MKNELEILMIIILTVVPLWIILKIAEQLFKKFPTIKIVATVISFFAYFLIILCIPKDPTRSNPKLMNCQANLSRYGKALVCYALDHQRQFPLEDSLEGIQVLFKQGYLEEVRNCPFAKANDFSYIYKGGYSLDDNKELPIMWDIMPHNGYIMVLKVQGNVKRYKENDFIELMKKCSEENQEQLINDLE